MARFAIGDLQGCAAELRQLVQRIGFSADRDQLWFVGDLVNRGPDSLECLRFVRALGANAVAVLGNHDLHLLALVLGGRAKPKAGDTLEQVLAAPDREQLIEWLLTLPLAHFHARPDAHADASHTAATHGDTARGDLMIHAGLPPQWTARQALAHAAEVQAALRADPRRFFDHMYGDQPDLWDDALTGMDRLRFIVNALTRLRVCTAEGRMAIKAKGPPPAAGSPLLPWFEVADRASRDTRIVFGHWSTLGFVHRDNVIGLDTGCVWGGALTAVNLDAPITPTSIPCAGYQQPGEA